MARAFVRLIPAGLGIAVPTMMSVGPEDALANLCKWPRGLFRNLPENCLPIGTTSEHLYSLAVVLTTIGVVWFFWPYLTEATGRTRMLLGISLLICGIGLAVFGLAFVASGGRLDTEQDATQKTARPNVVLLPGTDRLLLHNHGVSPLHLWGTTTGPVQEPVDKQARLIPVGHHYYFLTDKLAEYAKTHLGSNGEELVPFEAYIADETGSQFTARFALLVKMASGTMTIHTQQMGLVAGGWKKADEK